MLSIAPTRTAAVSPRPTRAQPEPSEEKHSLGFGLERWAGQTVRDLYLVSQFVAMGQLYKLEDARFAKQEDEHPPLQDVPDVKLERPFVMVPGWTTERARFEALGRKLTNNGLNGGQIVFVQNGSFFSDRACTVKLADQQVHSQHKVFEIVLTDPRQSPETASLEFERCFGAIQARTKSEKLDVDAYSMGGLGTRLYLDRGGKAVGKLMLLGTPNQGTRFAGLARDVIRRDIGFAMAMAGLKVTDLPALEWLAADNGQGGENVHLTELNARFPQQAARTEAVYSLGGKELLTPSSDGYWPVTGGDGLVEARRQPPPNCPARLLEGEKHHGFLNSDSDVYREMMGFYGWTPVS